MRQRPVTLIGVNDDGCLSLTSRAMGAVARAQVLVGGERHLAFFPDFRGERVVIKGGLSAVLERVHQAAQENHVCVLASGDPLFFGIGQTLINKVGADSVDVLPQPSSIQFAFARAGLKWDDATIVSLHGKSRQGLLTRLRHAQKVAVLTDNINTPQTIAQHMLAHGVDNWQAWVCENLCGANERVRTFAVQALANLTDVSPLNVLLLQRRDPTWRAPALMPFLHEDAFAKRMPKKGLITKREVRLLSLASLHIRPDSVVWDIGAGSGSVAIEAAFLAPRGQVFAIEVDPEGVAMCEDNIKAHQVDNIAVVHGRAPDACDALPNPDAVFVGGSKGSMRGILEMALARLQPGGRLVVNAITVDNVAEAYTVLREKVDSRQAENLDITQLQIARGMPLAHYMRYEALNPIQTFAVSKPQGEAAA